MPNLLNIVLTAFASVPLALASPPSIPDLTQKTDAEAAKVLAQPGAAGLSIAISRNGEIIFAKAYGSADIELDVAAKPDSIFRIASVTKQFTAAAIMRLVEQGKVSLDAEIQTYLPDFPKKEWPVTVRHLLNHTSGIWSYTDNEDFMNRDSALELTPKEIIAIFQDKPLEFEPGTKFRYSNSAYYLLGPIIEKASGKPYAVFLQDEFFTPLHLASTQHESTFKIIRNRAQGYSLKDGTLSNDQHVGADVPGAAGSLLSTAFDLVRWENALAGGKAVSPDSFKQMTTPPMLANNKPSRYGFGLQLDRFEDRPRISHGGGIFGFSSYLVTFPDDQLTIAILINSDAVSPGKLGDNLARHALGIPVFEPKDLDLSAADITRFSGDFAFQGIPLEIKLFERDGKLYAQATNQKETRLLYQGNGEFRPSFDTNVKFVFEEGSADNFVLHQNGQIPAKRKK